MFFRLRKLCENHAVQMCIKQCCQYRTGSEYCPQLPLNVISSHRYEAVDELGTFDIEEPAAGNFTEFYQHILFLLKVPIHLAIYKFLFHERDLLQLKKPDQLV